MSDYAALYAPIILAAGATVPVLSTHADLRIFSF
jgi:hypothetical protein